MRLFIGSVNSEMVAIGVKPSAAARLVGSHEPTYLGTTGSAYLMGGKAAKANADALARQEPPTESCKHSGGVAIRRGIHPRGCIRLSGGTHAAVAMSFTDYEAASAVPLLSALAPLCSPWTACARSSSSSNTPTRNVASLFHALKAVPLSHALKGDPTEGE